MGWIWITRLFDVRPDERRVTLLMFSYIFLLICILLIQKPIINALFLSELGAEQLPLGYILVAFAAVGSAAVYARLLSRRRLLQIISATLVFSAVVFAGIALCIFNGYLPSWLLYVLYPFSAVYAVLTASQFWVLANLVYNLRDAKRLFGFIGSGAILGGIFGGYLTSLFAPLVGNAMMLFLAAVLLLGLQPIVRTVWKLRISGSDPYQQVPQRDWAQDHPLTLIRKSKHLSYLALIAGISVLVAKLVDYLFSDFASRAIVDSEELSAFFGFWFSSFNLLALGVQLFLTRRVVGVWGVGFSLMLMPLGILFGSAFFLILPGLSAVVVVKAMDGILKQSVTKSASELLALPLPFDLKNKTKSFIDVVVDSLATGVAGLLLIFIIKALDLPSHYVAWLIIGLVMIWLVYIRRVRDSYYESFRLSLLGPAREKSRKSRADQLPALEGVRKVLREGDERQLLYMLGKVGELNDRRLSAEVRDLVDHPSHEVKIAALRNLYFMDPATVPSNIPQLLQAGNPELTEAVMDFMLQHEQLEPGPMFERYLDDPNPQIRDAALLALARQSRRHPALSKRYKLLERLEKQLPGEVDRMTSQQLKAIGLSGESRYFPFVLQAMQHDDPAIQGSGIQAAGLSRDPYFLPVLVELLKQKELRKLAKDSLLMYGPAIMPELHHMVRERRITIEACRFVPSVLAGFESQEAVRNLFELLGDIDLSVRIEVIRTLNGLRQQHPDIRFDPNKLARALLEECLLYQQTLSAMHTQIIVSYRNRSKSRQQVRQEERDARASLLDLLERRLDAGLERIFRLLGLKYEQADLLLAFERFRSPEEAVRSKAIDFLDHLLTGNLKQQILPIVEEAGRDLFIQEDPERRKERVPSEQQCFNLLMDLPDLRMRLAVLYLIGKQGSPEYLTMLRQWASFADPKIQTFANRSILEIQEASSRG